MARSKTDKLDREIEQAWRRLASGVQVDIMRIGDIFEDVRKSIAGGAVLDAAVKMAIAKYREN